MRNMMIIVSDGFGILLYNTTFSEIPTNRVRNPSHAAKLLSNNH
jgi:hypothetical protein